MLYYNNKNKTYSRKLRNNQTDAELFLWSRIRRRQIKNIQFYRQRPIANFIVDFYAPSKKLIIEIDGGQHFEKSNLEKDKIRDEFFRKNGLKVLRFDNVQILKSINEVLNIIFEELSIE